jgi:adenylosuccinate synthase
MFGPERRCIVVVGVQWGDEGKGKIVDVLSEEADFVVRYQGGANAGHTVVLGDEQFILHLIPSGILHPQTTCIIGNGVVLDPETFLTEIAEVEAQGVDVRHRLLVSDRTHLVLPYHKLLEQAAEARQQIGTTGRGIGPAYEDKFGRRGVRAGQLRNLDELAPVLARNVERVNALLGLWGAEQRADLAEHEALASRVAEAIVPMLADTGRLVHQGLREGRGVLLEGAQGALLDVDHGTYPFVTSSNTTAGGATTGSGIGPTAIDAVLGVVKAYTTRVGNGPLPTEAADGMDERLRTLGGEFGATTGRPRRCGWFDVPVARYAARVNGVTHLAVTKLDVLDAFDELPICTGYRVDGEEFDEMPSEADLLGRVEPVYDVVPGWQKPTGDVRRLEDLPSEARGYLERLQHELDTPIAFVSVGTRRDQIIEV